MTQEQLAEQFGITGRTVSRWETASNMPDLSLLVDLADFYEVDIREIINGERKTEAVTEGVSSETLKQVAEYSEAEKENLKGHMLRMSRTILIVFVIYLVLDITGSLGFISDEYCNRLTDYALGLGIAGVALNFMYLSGFFEKLDGWAEKHKKTV